MTTEAKVGADGWVTIYAPAPLGAEPGLFEAVVVLTPSTQGTHGVSQRRAGTLSGKVELSADFFAPLDDFGSFSK
jgi:hypothetical protein